MKKEEFEVAIENAHAVFKEIREKYAGLSGYLVLASPHGASPWGQCILTCDLTKLLEEKDDKDEEKAVRNMIHDSPYKEKAVELIKLISKYEKSKKSDFGKTKEKAAREIEKALKNLTTFLEKLEIKEDSLVEIRFDRLLYDLIFELQKDPLVSRKYTPQSRASINIVLGTIGELYQKGKQAEWRVENEHIVS
ncbi:MAG: hypothetical protein FJ139_01715 [Deltaproteobacteria bacterium]|nr:hypothetical protein [Deltaproteobacteria bacterium]